MASARGSARLPPYRNGSRLPRQRTVPEPTCAPQVVDWLADALRFLAAQDIPLPDVVAELVEQFRESAAPVAFARKWVRRRALLPLTCARVPKSRCPCPASPPSPRLTSPAPTTSPCCSPCRLPFTTKSLPHVSGHSDRPDREAGHVRAGRFEPHALWDGVAEELDRWLQVNPRA